MTNDRLYECSICKHINHVSRFHCQTCGTIPAQYSWLGKPTRDREDTFYGVSPQGDALTATQIEVFVAFGAERIGFSHATKVQLRTVPMDYYATSGE